MARSFQEYPELVSGFSEASDGTMSLKEGFENRTRYLAEHGLRPERTSHAKLIHGAQTLVVTSLDGWRIVDDADGLITASAGYGLAMTAADCLLVYAYDPIQQVIGMAHAGRRGLARGVLTEFLRTWYAAFPTKGSDLVISVSPGICSTHYTVSAEDAKQFVSWPNTCLQADDLVHLELRLVAMAQLTAGGINPSQVSVSPICTFENMRYFSYRRDHPPTRQLQVGYLMRK